MNTNLLEDVQARLQVGWIVKVKQADQPHGQWVKAQIMHIDSTGVVLKTLVGSHDIFIALDDICLNTSKTRVKPL